ncbi:NAD(P)-binding protein [Basidiobolus meristosporus CBS 931.73]|uniref:2,4-dienoyl-CoA reductase [(3E)-enoyl-CoA-producing] n=1 Tax=Basidiobolus meristosporus CBS 931.73 TaxID=1314790 RepID=A0A1Y1ZA72_9FUNG|nr:NAD(P)-binding protein [Basidiobolus meristosporus CBS 931.73]|eukprot:ORY06937.1 NAD(P)-binding protein [Basidiobolus meristosporus CBS 931.73]
MAAPVDTTTVFLPDTLKGKVAFVTGGGSGICKGIAEALLKHGAKVVIASRSLDRVTKAAEEMAKSTGGECFAVSADVRKPEDVEKAVAQAVEKFGGIDILVNGAAGNFLVPAENMSYNAFRTVIEIDLIGTFNVSKACFPHLKKSKGTILNISATLHYNGTPLQSHASSAKAGVDTLTKVFALEWGPYGIRVNSIAPGPISETAGIERLLPKEYAKGYIRAVPLQRLGSIRDIEHMAVFLASPSGNWISGSNFVVDGGSWLTGNSFQYPDSIERMRKMAKL